MYLNTIGGLIYNYDGDQPLSATNPVLNTITIPPNSWGLAACRNLNAATPAVTFYTIMNSKIWYYDGTAWVNTNHNAGGGSNLGGGGGYIFNYSISGEIWRYDGTGDAVLLIDLGSEDRIADVSVDCSGNFYILKTSDPQSLKKYNSSAILLNTYSLSGAPIGISGGGFAVFGNDIYYDDNSNFVHGTFSGNTVNFVVSPSPVGSIYDFANCPGTATPTQVFDSICANQFPYNWNGNSYSAPGTYMITLSGSAGCDSIVTLNLSIGTVTGIPQNVNLCPNQLPYSWNGNNYSTAGNYTAALTSSNGCDSVATLNLIISNPLIGIPENVAICPNQLPYTWNGNSYATTGTYTITLVSSSGCDSVATLNLSNGPAITGPTQNITVCANQIPYSWNGNSYSAAGNYNVTLTASSGCDSIATLNLSIASTITAPTQNITVCPNQLPYSWNGNNYSSAGNYNVTLTASSGCDSIATLNLSIGPSITGPVQNITVCPNQLPYSWNGNNYSSAGNYNLTLTASSGCDSIATLNLSIGNPITGPTQNISVCENQLPYSWNGNNYSSAGNYNVTLTAGSGCDSIATLNLSIGNPITGPTQNISVCENQLPYSWNGNNYSSAGNYNVTLTASSGCDSITTLNLGITQNSFITVDTSICPDQLPYHSNGNQYSTPGTYLLTLTNANGCDSIVTVNLSLYTPPVAFAGNDDTAQYNVPYQLSGSGGTNYEWSPAAPLNNAHTANPIAVITTTTTFYLNIKDNHGCVGLDTVLIKIQHSPSIYVPSGFSPNGDILNSVFRPILIDIKQLNYFRVYNRYGQMIFQDRDVVTGWNGTYQGKAQNMGTYTWTLEAVDIKGKLWKMHGTVVLIR